MPELYLNDLELKNIYIYYYKKGYIPIIIDKCSYLLINYFLIFLICFLTNCIDYSGLIHIDYEDNISNYINLYNIFPKNWYFIICLIILLIYTFCITVNTINQIKTILELKKFYKKKLHISSSELEHLKWEEIIDKLKLIYPDPNLNIYTSSIKILKKDNIISSIYKHNFEYLPYVSKLLEWNFIFCFIDIFFDNEYMIDSNNIDRDKLIKKAQLRCSIIFFINVISLPFTLYIIIIYLVIKYGEQFYNNPETSMLKYWNIKGYWKLRYYNELNHNYDIRSNEIKNICLEINKYHNENINKSLEILVRLINFVLGSLFVTLLILSVINENILMNVYVFDNKSILWFLGVLGAILTINRKLINTNCNINMLLLKNELFDKLKNKIPIINPIFFQNKNRNKIIKIIKKLYFSKLYYVFMEIIYLIISPFYIYKWYTDTHKYIDFIINELEEHFLLGVIPKKSIFTNIHMMNKNVHCYYSFINFIKQYPNWKENLFECNNLNNSLIDETFHWDNSIDENTDSFLYLNSLSLSKSLLS